MGFVYPALGWHRSGNRVTEEWLTDLAMVICKREDPRGEKVAACRYREVDPVRRRLGKHLPPLSAGGGTLAAAAPTQEQAPRHRACPGRDDAEAGQAAGLSVEESPLSDGRWNQV